MTVPASQPNRYSYAGNGVTTAFAYSSKFLADADLVVVLVNDTTGVETVKTLTTHYTVAGAGTSAGTVTMLTAPATGTTLVIYGDPVISQLVDSVNGDTLDVDAVIEAPLDKLTIIARRVKDIVTRSLRQPEGDTTDIGRLPTKADRLGKFLYFNATTGDPEAAAGTTEVPVSAFIATLLDDATAAAARATLAAAASGANTDITSVAAALGVKLPPWAAAGGTADAITATYSPANATLTDGMLLGFRASAANTTTTPTFAPDGLTAHPITQAGGSALIAGDIPAANAECVVRYNLANTRWELLNPFYQKTGSFTATLTGVSGSVTGTATWLKSGNMVTVRYPVLTGTSNTTACTITGQPAAIQPATAAPGFIAPVQDNSATPVAGRCDVGTNGVVTLFATVGGAAFTAANVKGLNAGATFTYSMV